MKSREQIEKIKNKLVQTRTAREARWRILRKFICPWRGIFEGRVEDNPSRRQMLRFTQTSSQAILRGASGMTTGMTPRNTAWFKPGFTDDQMMEASGARAWLDVIDKQVKACLSNGGFYQAIQSFNTDLLWAGCGLLFTESCDENPVRYECLQVGTWHVALNSEGKLETVLRRATMTPQDMERHFGKDALNDEVKRKLEDDPLCAIRVWQLVCAEDNPPFQYASYWWQDGEREKFLRTGGYYEMPYFFTSWHEGVTPYGRGPGDEALPDAIQLDKLERCKLEGLAKIVNPPMQAPTPLKSHVKLGAGEINYTPDRVLIQPIMDLAPFASALQNLREEIQTVGLRIEASLMATIFSSVSYDQRPAGMSATEFLERKREALQQLGPVISAYEPNVLTPLLFRTLKIIDRMGGIPTPPESLAGSDLVMQMEFISPMANALRQTGAETTRALFQDVATMAQATQNMEVLDKIDVDQMVDELAAGLGAPGSVIRADSDVLEMRQARQEAQAQQQAMAMQLQQAQTDVANAQAQNQQAQAEATLMQAEAEGGGDEWL